MDDVEYLERHGKDQSFLFLADSAKRDKSVYPSPAEYAVTFNSPFRNVVGFELVEVSVPRTDYIVDSTENTLTYSVTPPASILTWQADVEAGTRVATFSPGDYNLPQLVEHMNAVLANVAAVNGDTTVVQVATTTVPSEISNKVRLESSGPFCVLGDSSTIRTTIGLGDPVSVSGSVGYDVVSGYTLNAPRGASGVFVAKQGPLGNGVTFPTFVGPYPGDTTKYEGVYGGRVLREYFTATEAGTPTVVNAFFASLGTPPSGGWTINVRVAAAATDATIATGTTRSTGSDFDPVASTLVSTGNFVAGTGYYAEFTTTETTDAGNCAALWYDFSNLPPSGSYAAVNGVQVHTGQDFCIDVVSGSWGYEISPPGIVNLRGARYIKVRCPELEQYLYRDRVGEPSTAGIGMVDLIGYGFQNQRYNFVHYPATKFHPIGRIQKLTLRLERPDGTLYDAQGVDNTLLCAITYRTVPKTTPENETHPAAPGYDPDFIKIQQRRWKNESDAMRASRKTGYCHPGPR
jgi:Family of unknown function (DUF5901)